MMLWCFNWRTEPRSKKQGHKTTPEATCRTLKQTEHGTSGLVDYTLGDMMVTSMPMKRKCTHVYKERNENDTDVLKTVHDLGRILISGL
jgi:hypothetical protein